MSKLMSYKKTGMGGASKSFKRTTKNVDKVRKSKEKEIEQKKRRVARTNIREKKAQEKAKSKPAYEAKQYKTYSVSGARGEKMKLERKGYKVKTVKAGSGIFTEYKVFTDKPLPKEKYWD